jgi:hypothetical protein
VTWSRRTRPRERWHTSNGLSDHARTAANVRRSKSAPRLAVEPCCCAVVSMGVPGWPCSRTTMGPPRTTVFHRPSARAPVLVTAVCRQNRQTTSANPGRRRDGSANPSASPLHGVADSPHTAPVPCPLLWDRAVGTGPGGAGHPCGHRCMGQWRIRTPRKRRAGPHPAHRARPRRGRLLRSEGHRPLRRFTTPAPAGVACLPGERGLPERCSRPACARPARGSRTPTRG